MLIMLFIYLFKKVKKSFPSDQITIGVKRMVYKIKYIIPFFLLSNTNFNDLNVSSENVSFNVLKQNTNIGHIDIEKQTKGKTTSYFVKSNITAKLILTFNVLGKERSVYKGDTLIYSSVYRKINNRVKVDQLLSFNEGNYYFKKSDVLKRVDVDIIKQNLVMLYFLEPIGVHAVYCDKQNKMLKISNLGKGKYKVTFSKRNYSVFHYKKGKCTLIDVVHPLVEVQLKPTN